MRVADLPFSGGATKMVALVQMNEHYLRWSWRRKGARPRLEVLSGHNAGLLVETVTSQ